MCGKPRKLTALANLAWQVAKRLSQPAVMVKVSPGCDGERHGLPELDGGGVAGERVAFHFLGAAGVGAGGEGDEAAREPVGFERVEAGGGELAGAGGGEDGAGAAEGGIVEIDAAADIAEVGIAAGLEEAALGLLEIVREAAHLGGEGGAGAATSPSEPERISTRWSVSAQLTRQISMGASS